MLWSAFECTASNLREKEENLLLNKNDADVIALKQVQAKNTMYYDLQNSLGFVDETDATFQDILDTHEAKLQEALSNIQLSLYYIEQGGNSDSQNRAKAKYYTGQYDNYKRSFPLLVNDPNQRMSTRVMSR